jgi:hypothetical protein
MERDVAIGSSSMAKFSLNDVNQLLRDHHALIVHFSGTPKGSGSNFEHFFPDDLKSVIRGEAQSGVCCSTVTPFDNFDLENANATGCVGVVLAPLSAASIFGR